MKIRIIEYKCIVDNNNMPFGHAEKAIEETLNICKNLGFKTEVAASQDFNKASITLPNSIKVNDYTYRSIFKIIENLYLATKTSKNEDILFWFVNVDWYLYLFLSIHSFKQKKIATIYKERFDQINGFRGKKFIIGDLLYHFLKKGIKRIDLFFETFYSTNKKSNSIYLPDYMYTDFYIKYRNKKKINRVICPGTINVQKDIKGLISVFKHINYQLLIVGQFVDNSLYEELLKEKSSNIRIENRRLEYEEYYSLIAESTYCIAPYDIRKYNSATSGVIRESVYLDTIVIAPQRLLDNIGLNGIGYKTLEELIELFNTNKINAKIENDLTLYKEENVVENIRSAIMKLT